MKQIDRELNFHKKNWLRTLDSLQEAIKEEETARRLFNVWMDKVVVEEQENGDT